MLFKKQNLLLNYRFFLKFAWVAMNAHRLVSDKLLFISTFLCRCTVNLSLWHYTDLFIISPQQCMHVTAPYGCCNMLSHVLKLL